MFLVAMEAPSIIAPGTSVNGSGDSSSATPALRSVFEIELGLATCLSTFLDPLSARFLASVVRSPKMRALELALDLRTRTRCWLSLINAEIITSMAYPARGQDELATDSKEETISR